VGIFVVFFLVLYFVETMEDADKWTETGTSHRNAVESVMNKSDWFVIGTG